jgi:pimeloyl-ACP methyl ester carboxylesterase
MWIGIIVGVVTLLLCLLAGLTWIRGNRAKAELKAEYPPPGQMLDVGGYRLHIHCQGDPPVGSPTVVMDAGQGEPGLTWALVQPEVAGFTRVCTYDRAGLGWSERGPEPRTAANIVAELHTLLAGAGVDPPYVMVGHSAGGLYVRLFAHTYPDEVSGLVLVDAGHEERWLRYQESLLRLERLSNRMMTWGLRFLQVLNSVGLPALNPDSFGSDWPTPIPEPVRGPYLSTMFSGTKCLATLSEEIKAAEGNFAAVREAKLSPLGDIPLVVVTSGKSELSEGRAISAQEVEHYNKVTAELQAELVALSPQGKQVIAEKSGHYIQIDQPELVIDAIREVVEAARA